MGRTPIQLAYELGDFDIIEILLGYEPSTRVSSSGNTVNDMVTIRSAELSTVSYPRSCSSQSYLFHGNPSMINADDIISIHRQDSSMSQLTTSSNGLDIPSSQRSVMAGEEINVSRQFSDHNLDTSIFSDRSHRRQSNLRGTANGTSDNSTQQASPKKPKGFNRRIRKVASRVMSYVAPRQYPKSRRGQR